MISKKLILLFLVACNVSLAQTNGFSLEGKTADIEEGTYLYLRDLVNGGNLDSALVKNNSFSFTTDLPEPTLYVMLFTRDRKNFVELWLEEKSMTFDASISNFKEAEVTGSRNHALFEKYREEFNSDPDITDETKLRWEKEFIKNNPGALLSAYILYGNERWTQNEISNAYLNFSDEVRDSSLGQRISLYLEKDLPQAGEHYADFSLPNFNNQVVKLSDLKSEGKLTLLQFWSSGCGFSREMNHTLTELHNKYNSQGFEIITVSRDTNKQNWFAAIRDDKASWPQLNNLIDSDKQIFQDYGIYSTPSNLLIDGEGIIVARNLRGADLEIKVKEKLAD